MTMRIHALVAVLVAMLIAWAGAGTQDSSMTLADRIVKSETPVLIDFWAVWCAPCRMLSPIIKDLEKEYAGRIKVMKINVDVHRQIAAYFKVSSIPAIYIVKDRAVVKYIPGLRSKEDYRAAIEEVLAMDSVPAQPGKDTPGNDAGGTKAKEAP
jgi:thioredoxin